MYPGTYFELLTILMLWRRSATTMPSHGWVAKVCATKIATSRGENIKKNGRQKVFFCAPPLRRCGHFLNIVFSAKTKTATCRDLNVKTRWPKKKLTILMLSKMSAATRRSRGMVTRHVSDENCYL